MLRIYTRLQERKPKLRALIPAAVPGVGGVPAASNKTSELNFLTQVLLGTDSEQQSAADQEDRIVLVTFTTLYRYCNGN